MEATVQDGVLYAYRIAKDKDYELEKGDVGYAEDKDCDDLFIPVRIYLKNIISWEMHVPTSSNFNRFRNKDEKVIIECEHEAMTLVMTLKQVDRFMSEFNKNLLTFIKN